MTSGGIDISLTIPTVGHWTTDVNGSANGTTYGHCELDTESSSVLVGVMMGLFGSIFINSGQNLQSTALQSSEEVRAKPHKSRAWQVGMGIFIVGSVLNFVAFTFASASILVPIEASQFVTNVGFNKFVNKKPISKRMVRGVATAVMGVVITTVFGSTDSRCFTVPALEALWGKGLWWGWLASSLSLAAAARYVHVRYSRRLAEAEAAGTEPPKRHEIVLPVTFAVSASLTGGAQMIVHSKAVAELLELQFSGIEPTPMATWYFWLELTILATTGVYWLYKLNESLALYEPLFIIPLMQSSYILFGVVAGGIYFEEFAGLHRGPAAGWGWPLFLLGMGCILVGLSLIAPPPTAGSADGADRVKIAPAGARNAADGMYPPVDRADSPAGVRAADEQLPEQEYGGGITGSIKRKLAHRRTPSTSTLITAAAQAAAGVELGDVHITADDPNDGAALAGKGAGGAGTGVVPPPIPRLNTAKMRVRQCSSRDSSAPSTPHSPAGSFTIKSPTRRRSSREVYLGCASTTLPEPPQREPPIERRPSGEREVIVLQKLPLGSPAVEGADGQGPAQGAAAVADDDNAAAGAASPEAGLKV